MTQTDNYTTGWLLVAISGMVMVYLPQAPGGCLFQIAMRVFG